MTRIRTQIAALLILTLAPSVLAAEAKITSPKEQFGFNIGDDYQLVNFARMAEYWKKLDQESDRLTVVDAGKTAEGHTMLMAIIASPENHRKPTRYKDISPRLDG